MSVILRFLLTVILLGIAFFLVWFGLAYYGQNRSISEYATPLVENLKKEPRPIIWTYWHQGSEPQKYAYLDAHFTGNSWEATLANKNYDLKELLLSHDFSYLILNINLNSPKALPQLRTILKEKNHWQKIVICSAGDGVLRDLRELEPEWSFCNGEIYMARMLGFASIKLESLMRIESDIFFIHLNNLNLHEDHFPIIAEAHRQKKLVFIGPVTRPSEKFDADGWLVKSP